jgi:hypothetical protein
MKFSSNYPSLLPPIAFALPNPSQSGTCLPIPRGNHLPLLSPVWDTYSICPTYDDRWDLRTKTLGCHVNTLTVFTCIITVVCTLLGLGLIAGIWKAVAYCFAPLEGAGGRGRGWRIALVEGDRTGEQWFVGKPWEREGSLGYRIREWWTTRQGLSAVEERRRLMEE